MRVQCPICAELFSNSSDITACPCGHTFHNQCLAQWRERSNTCPQCRAPLKVRFMINKLYFSDGEGVENREDDYDSLKNKNNELEVNLREAKRQVSELKETVQVKDLLMNETQMELKNSEGVAAELKKTVKACKLQLNYFQKENTRLVAAENELIVTKKEIDNYANLQQMIDGTLLETGDILNRYSQDPASFQQLATACSLLRKELKTTKAKKEKQTEEINQLKKNYRIAKAETMTSCSKYKQLLDETLTLKDSVASLERELQSSRKKGEVLLKQLHEERQTENTSFDRFINESPAPQPKFSTPKIRNSDDNVLKVGEISRKSNKETVDFAVKTSFVAATVALKTKTNNGLIVKSSSLWPSVSKPCKDFNIFKRHRQQPMTLQAKHGASSSRDQGYDGFGGHSKPDVFPSGSSKSNAQPKRIKRSFSSGNIPKLSKF